MPSAFSSSISLYHPWSETILVLTWGESGPHGSVSWYFWNLSLFSLIESQMLFLYR